MVLSRSFAAAAVSAALSARDAGARIAGGWPATAAGDQCVQGPDGGAYKLDAGLQPIASATSCETAVGQLCRDQCPCPAQAGSPSNKTGDWPLGVTSSKCTKLDNPPFWQIHDKENADGESCYTCPKETHWLTGTSEHTHMCGQMGGGLETEDLPQFPHGCYLS
eukprot:gene23295-31514_t